MVLTAEIISVIDSWGIKLIADTIKNALICDQKAFIHSLDESMT